MVLSPGARFGQYEIVAGIGAGGMGEVYRARDPRLGRDVALKILPELFTKDGDRLARFEQEAKALASFNHPNIAGIYQVEESAGVTAIVMEFVDGVSLADLIARGPMPAAEAIAVARQVGEALDAAHDKGIVHRDLKPANIKISREGTVKVLDFGIAKTRADQGGADATAAPTAAIVLTLPGAVVGTAPYMSPEQARGLGVDKRTDIWAFGCVLFEMLTGRRAFSGPTHSDIVAAILGREPDWDLLPPDTSPTLRRILRRCLEKDVKTRARDVGDILADLGEAASNAPAYRSERRGRQGGWAVAAVLAVALAGVATATFVARRAAPPPADRRVQFGLTVALRQAFATTGSVPTPSPSGELLAFIANDPRGTPFIWIRPLDSIEAKPLAGTENASGTTAWSPDGRWLAFWSDGKLKKISPNGGPPQTIADVSGFQDGAWGRGGQIVFRTMNRAAFVSVAESGGPVRAVTTLDTARGENSHRFVDFLPDGRRFLFTSRCAERENNALFVGSIDSSVVTRVMPAQARVSYIPGENGRPDMLLYYKDGALMAQAFDLSHMALQGEPVPVVDKIAYAAASISAGFRASADGRTLIIQQADATDNQLTWFSRDGAVLGTVGPPGDYLQPRLSPAGDRVAFTKPDPQNGNRDIWYMDLARGASSRVTVNGANDWFPVWSPDNRRMAFDSDRDGGPERPFIKSAIDSGAEEVLVPAGVASPWDWSLDGQWMTSSGDGNVWVQRMGSTPGKPFQFLGTPFLEFGGRFSPDGRWITYVSNETGRPETYVRPFAGSPSTSEGKIQISADGGDFPTWKSDGSELYYMAGDSAIYAVSTRDLARPSPGLAPVRLFKACPDTEPVLPPLTQQTYGYAFDTRDGQRFLVNCRVQPVGRYVVILNPLAGR